MGLTPHPASLRSATFPSRGRLCQLNLIALTSEEAFELTREFNLHKGVYPEGQCMKWETLDEVRQRMRKVADKYADYDKVIFVGHGMAFRTLTYIEKMKPAEIIECTYTIGQEDCIYSFC